MSDSKQSSPLPTAQGPKPGDRATIKEAVIRIAGNSQDGIQTVGEYLARLSGRSQMEVMTFMTIPATISGGPSIYQVRMGDSVLSAGDDVDILVAFYQHSYEDHIDSLREGGLLVYDADHVTPNLDDRRFTNVGVPMTSLTVEAVGGTGKDKGKNMFLFGLLARMFDLDMTKIEAMINAWGKNKNPAILKGALGAIHAGHSYELGKISKTFKFESNTHHHEGRTQVVMSGNQSLAYGLLTAGIRFGAAYPITPWSSIMEILRAELPKYGGIFVQAEDELAAIAMALGSSYGGRVAVTGSSGPGLSLKSEALGWGVMAEMPLVIIDVQRGGPSTGLPTKVEQSDLNHAVFGSHGDAPRIVLACASVEDAFYTAIEAVNLAREYSCPVILLSDQAIGTRVEAWDEPDLKKLAQDLTPRLEAPAGDFLPYQNTPSGITHHIPPGTRLTSGQYPVVTGLEHDEKGHPGEDPSFHVMMVAKRRRKLQTLAAKLPPLKIYGPPEGNVLLVGWGSTQGPIREAVDRARANGDSVSSIHIRYLSPLQPGLEKIFEGFNHILVVEMNDEGLYGYGQLAGLLRARYCDPRIRGINKSDGLPFKVREILERAQADIAKGVNAL